MIGNNHLCSSCNAEPTSFVCISYGELKFLGSSCLATSVRDSHSPHYIIRLCTNSAALKKYPTGKFSFNTENQSENLSKSSQNQKSVQLLTSKSDSRSNSLSELSSLFLLSLNLYKDLQTSLGNYDHFDRFSSGRYTYYDNSNGRVQFYVYDIVKKSVELIPDPEGSNLDFYRINSFGVSDGNVLSMYLSEREGISQLYIRNIYSKRSFKLPYEHKERWKMALLHHQNALYVFGGGFKNENAEIFSLTTNRQHQLQNMKHGKARLSPILVEDKIYLFHGSSTIIEVLYTHSLKFQEIEFNNQERFCNFVLALKHDDNIYLITENFIQKLNTSLQLTSLHTNLGIYPNNCTVYNNHLFYFNLNSSFFEKFDLSLSPPFIKSRSLDHYRKNNNRRYIYVSKSNQELYRVDLKRCISELIFSTRKIMRFIGMCMLPNGNIIVISIYDLQLFDLSTHTFEKISETPDTSSVTGIIYHSNYLYIFADGESENRYVYRFDLENKNWTKLLEAPNCKMRFRASCVSIENKIYIIGGYVDPIDVYDIETNRYESTAVSIGSKFAVSVSIEDRMYVMHENRYIVLNKELEILEEGESNQSKYEILLISNVAVYRDRIYFFDSNTGLLQYFDIRSHQRVAEAVSFIRAS